jgi:hypothetical protein
MADELVVSAEREARAQLAIIRALKVLKPEARARVMEAVGLLLEADHRVPGILDAVRTGIRRNSGGGDDADTEYQTGA